MVLFQSTSFNFGDIVSQFQQMGVYEYFLPFLLIFAIIFAILEKTKILGKDKTNVNVLVSIIIGLLLIVQQGIVATINLFLPRVSLIIVVILMGLMVVSLLAGKQFEGLSGNVFSIAVIIAIIALLVALLKPVGYGPSWLSTPESEAILRIMIPLVIFFLIVMFITKGGKKEDDEGKASKFLKGLEAGFKGGNS